MKLQFSGLAKEDLIDLWEYIAAHDELSSRPLCGSCV